MKRMWLIVNVFLIVEAFLMTGLSCAKHRPPKPEDKVGRLISKLSDSLSLTEEQKVKVAQIKKEITEKNEAARTERKGEGKEVDEAFAKEILKDKFDVAGINKLLDQKAEKKEELRRFMVEELAKFHALLTIEQKQKLAVLVKELGPEPPPRGEQGPGKQ